MRNNVKKKAHHHASSDSDIDSGENSDDVSRSQPENLNKCLSLIFNFLDTNFNNCQAWSILSENLRSICLLGMLLYLLHVMNKNLIFPLSQVRKNVQLLWSIYGINPNGDEVGGWMNHSASDLGLNQLLLIC